MLARDSGGAGLGWLGEYDMCRARSMRDRNRFGSRRPRFHREARSRDRASTREPPENRAILHRQHARAWHRAIGSCRFAHLVIAVVCHQRDDHRPSDALAADAVPIDAPATIAVDAAAPARVRPRRRADRDRGAACGVRRVFHCGKLRCVVMISMGVG
jgi:hypothetical protein